jgi:hypothetical protein
MPEGGKNKTIIHFLPVYGCFATGLIYTSIGIIAILSFLKLKDGGADENRLFAFLNNFLVGKILVFVILAGTACWIIWRFYETFTDPYDYGKEISGIAKRTGIAVSTFADFMIAYAAFRFLAGTGNLEEGEQLNQQRSMVKNILKHDSGELFVIIIGVIIIITALIQLFYGITRGYKERLEVEEFSPVSKKLVYFFGLTGYFARGIIIGITGFFYLKAGVLNDAQIVVDTDKAFDFIGDNIGHIWFILTAAGTIFYGIFMFALGTRYDIDRD